MAVQVLFPLKVLLVCNLSKCFAKKFMCIGCIYIYIYLGGVKGVDGGVGRTSVWAKSGSQNVYTMHDKIAIMTSIFKIRNYLREGKGSGQNGVECDIVGRSGCGGRRRCLD